MKKFLLKSFDKSVGGGGEIDAQTLNCIFVARLNRPCCLSGYVGLSNSYGTRNLWGNTDSVSSFNGCEPTGSLMKVVI